MRFQRVLFELAVSELLCFSFHIKELAGQRTPALEMGNCAIETFFDDLCKNRGVCKVTITIHGRSLTVDLTVGGEMRSSGHYLTSRWNLQNSIDTMNFVYEQTIKLSKMTLRVCVCERARVALEAEASR